MKLTFLTEGDEKMSAIIDELSARIGMDPDRITVLSCVTGGSVVIVGTGGQRRACVELEIEVGVAETVGYGFNPPTPEEACVMFKDRVDDGSWLFDPHLQSISIEESFNRELNTLDENGEPTNAKYNEAPE